MFQSYIAVRIDYYFYFLLTHCANSIRNSHSLLTQFQVVRVQRLANYAVYAMSMMGLCSMQSKKYWSDITRVQL